MLQPGISLLFGLDLRDDLLLDQALNLPGHVWLPLDIFGANHGSYFCDTITDLDKFFLIFLICINFISFLILLLVLLWRDLFI